MEHSSHLHDMHDMHNMTSDSGAHHHAGHEGHTPDMNMSGDSGHSGHHDHAMMMMHSMTFHFGYTEKILFSFWDVATISGFISSLVGIFIISLVYEGIKYYREYLFWENLSSINYKSVTNGQARAPGITETVEPISSIQEVLHKQPAPKIWSKFNAFQTVLHLLQMTISYLLMLIFMTFNVWLCLAVVLGSSTGYFFFGWKKTLVVERNEHCH